MIVWSERDSKICEHCGAPAVEHDYQQLARECYPKQIKRLRATNAELVAALQQIESWSQAYPLAAFPEPDFARAAELLKAGGITLDAVSASNMRHVVKGVGEIARAALTGFRSLSALPTTCRRDTSAN